MKLYRQANCNAFHPKSSVIFTSAPHNSKILMNSKKNIRQNNNHYLDGKKDRKYFRFQKAIYIASLRGFNLAVGVRQGKG